MPRAIAYCRVSDPRQVNEEGSLARQESEARAHATSKGYSLVEVFIERGESAKTDNRTELKRMLGYLKSQKIDVLIIPRIDRLARNSLDYLTLKVTLTKLGTRIESVGESIEDTPVGRFLETILAGTAQLDNEIKSERSRNGMIDAFKVGRWIWRAPFGYEHRGGNIVPKEPEASVVRLIFRLSAFLSPAEVLREASKQGFPLKRTRLHEILQSSVYAGRMRAFGMEIEGAWEPLVTSSAIKKVKSPAHYLRDNPDFPLKHTCRCCGELTASWSRGRSSRYAYYRCRTCGRNIGKHRLEAAFRQFLRDFAIPGERMKHLEAQIRRHFHRQHGKKIKQLEAAARDLNRYRDLQKQLALKNAAGIIPDDLAQEQIADLRSKELDCQLTLRTPIQSIDGVISSAQEMLEHPDHYWTSLSDSNRLRFQRIIFPEGVTVSPKLRFGTKKMRLLKPAKMLAMPHLFGLEPLSERDLNQLIADFQLLHEQLPNDRK